MPLLDRQPPVPPAGSQPGAPEARDYLLLDDLVGGPVEVDPPALEAGEARPGWH